MADITTAESFERCFDHHTLSCGDSAEQLRAQILTLQSERLTKEKLDAIISDPRRNFVGESLLGANALRDAILQEQEGARR